MKIVRHYSPDKIVSLLVNGLSIDKDFAVTMSGPATRVGLVEFDEGALNEENVE